MCPRTVTWRDIITKMTSARCAFSLISPWRSRHFMWQEILPLQDRVSLLHWYVSGMAGFSVIPNSSNAFPLLTEHNQPNDVPPSLVEGRASTTRCSCDAHSDVFTSLALLLASSPRSPGDGHQG